MKPSILLRVSSVIAFLYWAGHTSGFPWTPGTGEQEMAILDAMRSHDFDAEGAIRSYWDFYVGFGLIISGFLLTMAILLWQVSTLAKTESSRLRPLFVTVFVSFVINAVLCWLFFFTIPVVMAFVIAACIGLVFLASYKIERSRDQN